MNIFTWVVILILITINALYVAAEFGAVSVRHSRIRQRAEEGNGLAIRLLPVIDDAHKLDRYIAACQIGITLSSLILGAYGQATLAVQLTPVFQQLGGLQEMAAQSTSAVVVLLGLTVLQMILGELVPKSIALQHPTQVALYTVLPMKWSLSLLSWFIAVLNGSGLAVLRLMGVEQAGHRHIHAPEEIDLLIAESREGGFFRPDEHQRLRRALQLGARPVRQLMVPRQRIASVNADAPFEELLREVRESPYTRLPVYRGTPDNIIGMIHTKDVVLAYVNGRDDIEIEALVRPILTVHESVKGDRLLALLRERRSHQALVADEYGGVAGLVTIEDVLSELIGELSDEFKADDPHPEPLPDGRVRLPGSMRLEDAEPWTGVAWEGKMDTVAGRVIEAVGQIPVPGQRVTIDGVEVEIERMSNRVVDSVLVTPVAEIPEDTRG